MARPGRAPKPSGLRLAEGTDRRGRTGRTLDRSTEPIPANTELEPPYAMGERVRHIWDAVVAELDQMGLAAACDSYQLAGYCEAAALFERASQELEGAALVVEGAASEVANKLIGIRERAQTQMLRFAQEFGLTPAARVRVETNKRDGSANPFA